LSHLSKLFTLANQFILCFKNTTVKQTITMLSIALLFVSACNNTHKQSNKTDAISAHATASFEDENSSEADAVQIDFTSFPEDSLLPTKVLTVGVFHGDEVESDVAQKQWYGVFSGTSGYYLAETKITIQYINDAVVDANENEQTGWLVKTINKDSALILVAPSPILKPHNIQNAPLLKEQLLPGDTLQIQYLGNNYMLYATGYKNSVGEDANDVEILNYKLYVSATIKGRIYNSLLVAKPNFSDAMITLLFAGDIDGDGVMDLIIDTARHYNVSSPTLYLSKPAENNEVLKPIGMHTSVGC